MELEFERDVIVGYDPVAEVCLCQEETLESIVPDACPDILRIVDVYGQAALLSWQAEEGMAVVNGLVHATILYQPEEGEGLRRMEASVPFACRAEAPGLTDRGIVLASPRLRSAEARALNPRKVLLRVDLAVDVAACQPSQLQFCQRVSSGEDTICQKQKECDHIYLFSVQEKPFTFTENIRVQAGPAQVLAGRCSAHCTESRLIGNKLILKGSADLDLLLQEPGGTLTTFHESLPISQVMEVNGAGEESTCQIGIEILQARWEPDVTEDRSLELNLELLAQARIYARRPVTLLQDLYSTKFCMDVDREPFLFRRVEDSGARTQSVRDLLDTPEGVRGVVDCRVVMGPVVQSRDGEELQLSTRAQLTVLYLDEQGSLRCARKEIPVRCSFPCSGDTACFAQSPTTSDLFATPAAGGIEVRLSVEFFCRLERETKADTVVRARVGAVRDDDHRRPSVVLRLAAPGEELWDLAKSYGTTMEGIRQANGLEENSLPLGQMLLIPNCR